MGIQTINPATEQMLQYYDFLDKQSIDQKIADGHAAYLSWRKTSFSERKNLVLQLTHILKRQKDELAHLMSVEMGKPIADGTAEIDKCIWLCEHYAEHAETYLAPKMIKTEMKKAMVCYKPLGIVFGIMPWNFPFWQVFRFAIPTIMAGNAAILKHAPITFGTGNKIEQLFLEANFPAAVFQHLIVDNDGALSIIQHEAVSAVTLTGSERAGRSVGSHAGKYLKKSVMELGGCDPYLILEDADLDLAAHCIVNSRLRNSGQTCIAAKRVIVLKSVEKELIDKLILNINLFKMGDPLDPKTTMGPLAREDLRNTVHLQIEKSVKQGAKLLLGGIIPDCKGYYYPPTLLADVKPGMVAFDEELFGPVISICPVDNEEEAIVYANTGQYGLGAAVFTRDVQKGERIATNEIEAGVCFVNSFVASDPRLPFGGIKHSGYGRELSQEGILEFVNTKTIAISDS